jgi:hypothetical protein
MIKRKPYHCLVALVCAFCFLAGLSMAPPPAAAFDLSGILGTVVKVGGAALIVKQFGGQIDSFINTILGQKGIQQEGKTKVVPVLRVGSGSAVGAVQVVGPAQQVDKVAAVAELELSLGGAVRARALVPVTTNKVETSSIKGVGGVGVSANIKIPL